MTLPLTQYSKINHRYCIRYLGRNASYINQLKYVLPIIHKAYPDLEIILKFDEEFCKKEFGYVRDLLFNGKDNPILKLLEESEINLSPKETIEFFQL